MSESSPARKAILEQAVSQLQCGAFEEATASFTAFLLIEPTDAAAFQGRAVARFQLKDWSAAEADFRKAYSLDSEEPENALGLGMSLAMRLEIYPAIEVLEALLQRRPDFVRGYIQLGLLHLRIGAIAKGKEILEKALQYRPTLLERRLIESTLKEQKALDKNRYYRPDFEALRKKS